MSVTVECVGWTAYCDVCDWESGIRGERDKAEVLAAEHECPE